MLTPGLLVRSGIGRKSELERLGIDAMAAVEGVGANLADHPALPVLLEPRFPEFCAPELPLVQTIRRYTSDGSSVPLDVNIELMTRAGSRSGDVLFMLAPSLEWVEGRGEVRQTSADPRSSPEIISNFGQNDADLARHVTALQDALGLAAQAPLAEFISAIRFPDPARSSRDDLTGSGPASERFWLSPLRTRGWAHVGPHGGGRSVRPLSCGRPSGRRRRLDHADRPEGQHQPLDHHDR